MQRCISTILLTFAGLLIISTYGQENKPPLWDEDAVKQFLTGVREDTAKNSLLGKLLCIDPEGDPIYYRLTSGTAVKVAPLGDVTLAVTLDFESSGISYDLGFSCIDLDPTNGRLRRTQEVTLNTEIVPDDANDNPPQISTTNPDGFSYFVKEDVSVGDDLPTFISISDKDKSDNAMLDKLYFICDSPFPDERVGLEVQSAQFCEKFSLRFQQLSLGQYRATITVKGPLDYESRPVYSTKLIAIDGGQRATAKLTSTVNVQINVLDAQDMKPVFTNVGASATVNENTPIGTTVFGFSITARDGDLGDRRPVKLSIIEASTVFNPTDARDAFNLSTTVLTNANDGIYMTRLIVNNQLDREEIATAYKFVVKVTELDKDTLAETTATATATYSAFVTDYNDNAPTFSQSIYYVNVTETSSNEPVQINGFRIDCNDPDETSNARYNVRVIEQSFNTYSIIPALSFTGSASMFLQVADAKYLDYDNPLYREQKIVVEAREFGTSELLSSSTTILLSLRDINDNQPVFEQTSYEIVINEDVKVPYDLMKLKANDRDSGVNGQIVYELQGETDGLFTVDPNTGQIVLQGAVDYEATSEYVFLAYASDLAEISRQTQVQVTITIRNINDEGPIFSLPSYQTSVQESNRTFFNPVIIKAVDNEDGTGLITYRIVSGQSPNNAFFINTNTGELRLNDFLSYEDTPKGPNGEPSGQFSLIVEASDNGVPPQTNNVAVRISVIDVNDHTPVLSPTRINIKLSELAPPGKVITKINGTDDDSGEFGTITYRIGQGLSDNFYVNPSTGLITVGDNRDFNYDVKSSYELQVIASDGGAPQKSATATVFIEILDGNNQSPQFSELLYYIYVDETKPVDTVIQTIAATDTDSTANLVYSILPTNIRAVNPDGNTLSAISAFDYKNAFGVNNDGGIYIKTKLSREAASEISFTLKVVDTNTAEGASSATTQVTVLISGLANTDITFDDASTVYMNEDAQVDYHAITVTARDPNNNAVNRYEPIQLDISSANFRVQSNGRITLVTEIDYENDPQKDHLHRVVVRAVSNDGTQSATITATVSIVDVNDNDPIFSVPVYTARVPETDIYPMEVATIYATDADSGSYGPLEFSISGGLDNNDFAIFSEPPGSQSRVSRRAAVIVSQGTTLDYNRRPFYSLDITVVDNANQAFSNARRSTRAKLNIQVIDENNNKPIFIESFRSLAVPETAALGQSIATLIATDRDVDRNGDISYFLQSNGDLESDIGLDLFNIGLKTGTVRVRQSLLGRGGKTYSMRVKASDNGERPMNGYMDVQISVQNTEDDDGNPKWNSPVDGLILEAPEEEPNYVLSYNGRTKFFDVTPRTGGGVKYVLSAVGAFANSFKINEDTGEITIVDSLDREKQEMYNLLVFAEDISDRNVIRSGRQLWVQLTDRNDNDPTFTNPRNYRNCEAIDRPLVVLVEENIKANVQVYTVTACDPDVGKYARISYELYNDDDYCKKGNEESILRLDPTTGVLSTIDFVDYEARNEYRMCIKAKYPGDVRRKRSFDLTELPRTLDDVAYLEIQIVDKNDNGPRFPQSNVVTVVRTQPEQGPVITLKARDADGPENNVILYQVTSSVFVPADDSTPKPAANVFRLRSDRSGALYPALPSYLSFVGGKFILVVQAKDSRNETFTDDVSVTIYVYDDGQAMRLILDTEASNAIGFSSNMFSNLNGVEDRYTFNYLQISEHRTGDDIEVDKTDVCFLTVDEDTNTILNVRQVVSLLDQDKYRQVLSKNEYKQLDRGFVSSPQQLCYPQNSSEDDVRWKNLWWVLVAVAIFIFVCCIILLVLIVMLYDRYRRFMETRQTYLVSQ